MIRQSRLMALVGAFLIGCAVLLVVGCAGVRSEGSQKEKQGQAEDTKQEQGHSPEATASEEAQCERTRTTKVPRLGKGNYITNDLPGCPKGGLLLGTDKADKLGGKAGDDEIRGLGAKDEISGGVGNDVIDAGPGDDAFLWDGKGDDITYGGDGNDEFIDDKGDDVIYGGDGDDFFYPTSGKDVIYGGMATISSTFPKTASQTSSIVAKARTNMAYTTIPKWIRTTTWIAAARRRSR